MTKLAIDIWSDVMCPWCLVGWGNLQQGLKLVEGEIEAEVRWHAFELNPDMAQEGEDRTEHIARKYGRTLEESKSVQGRMREAAEAAGVSLDYEGAEPPPPAMMWNTFEAHKLLAWALAVYGPAQQTELKLALFAAHFNDRRPIGERAELLDIVEEIGFDRAAAEVALDDEDLARHVRLDEQQAYDANIMGVPAMVIEGKFMVPGAQPPETYANVLRRVAVKMG